MDLEKGIERLKTGDKFEELKAGDKFKEAGRYFIIEEVMGDRYLSREITKEEAEGRPKKKKSKIAETEETTKNEESVETGEKEE